jgi:hypothetical protein
MPHDLRVGVQLELMLEMVVGQRNEPDARGLQYSAIRNGLRWHR